MTVSSPYLCTKPNPIGHNPNSQCFNLRTFLPPTDCTSCGRHTHSTVRVRTSPELSDSLNFGLVYVRPKLPHLLLCVTFSQLSSLQVATRFTYIEFNLHLLCQQTSSMPWVKYTRSIRPTPALLPNATRARLDVRVHPQPLAI